MRRLVYLRHLPRACRREMVRGRRSAVARGRRAARRRLRGEADLAPLLPDQGHRGARRAHRAYAVVPGAVTTAPYSLCLCRCQIVTLAPRRSEEHTSELQSLRHLVCRLLLEKKKHKTNTQTTQ